MTELQPKRVAAMRRLHGFPVNLGLEKSPAWLMLYGVLHCSNSGPAAEPPVSKPDPTSPRREASLFNLPVAQGVTGIFLAPRMGAEALPPSSPAVKRQDGNLGVFEHVFGDPAHDQQIAFQCQGLGEQDLPPTGRPPLPCLARSGRSPSGPAMAPLE